MWVPFIDQNIMDFIHPTLHCNSIRSSFLFWGCLPPPFLLLWNSYSYSPDCIFRHYQKDLCCSLIRVCCSKVHRCLHCMLPSVIFRNIIQEGRSNPGCFCSSMKHMVAGCWWGRGIGRRWQRLLVCGAFPQRKQPAILVQAVQQHGVLSWHRIVCQRHPDGFGLVMWLYMAGGARRERWRDIYVQYIRKRTCKRDSRFCNKMSMASLWTWRILH